MTGIYLLLGSNLGDKLQHLSEAGKLIDRHIGRIVLKSSCYHTEAWMMPGAPSFLNQVLRVDYALAPLKVLEAILKLEALMGRTRQVGYQSRTIDIDLLYYDDLILDHPDLIIPHPRISERRFVLEPLVEVAPEFIHPVFGSTNRQLLDKCPDPLSVTRI